MADLGSAPRPVAAWLSLGWHTPRMPLEEYRRKRDFGKTPEPAPAEPPGTTGRFVVQRHRATRLHYDFRLEIEGVLVSWAVPKGPSLDCKIRRMAIHVEDHPIEYFDFEGIIPAKQYGAGDVIVWDWGTWEPEAPTLDPRKAVEDGELKFQINGEKLKGRFTIVRTSRRPGSAPARAFEKDEGEQWLLIHKCDETQPGWDAEDYPKSVKTGRTNDEVKAQREAIWISEMPAATAEIDLAGAKQARMPKHIEPMLATLATKPFDDDDWLFEIKWDGFRVQSVVDDGKVKLWTRSLKDAETYFPNLLSPPRWIEAQQAIVDGEVVALDDDGRPDFSLLQTKLGSKTGAGLMYQAFDLLYLDGRSLLEVPLEDRKRLLRSVLKEHPRVRFATHVEGEGRAFFAAAEKLGLEGMIAKLRRSPYEPGRRTSAWLKIKIRPEQELVVGGWTPGSGNAKDLGAMAVGYYEDGKLRFAGKVGSGFTGAIRRDLLDRLGPLAQEDPPFDPPPPKDYKGRWGGELNDVTWVRPELVIRAELGGWTRDGVVRQAAYKGIEAGRDPKTVVRETPVSTTSAVRAAESEVPPMPESKPAPSGAAPSKSKSKSKAKPSARGTTAGGAASEFPGATPEELEALDALGNEGVWRVDGHDLKVTNLDKVLFKPAPARRQAHHQARADPLLRHDRADDPAASQGPAAQPQSISQWSRGPQLLAEEHQGNRPEVADPLARDRRRRPVRPRRQQPPHRRRTGRARVAREPGELRDPRLDWETARSVATGVRLHRHRSRREDDLGRHTGPGAAVSGGARAPRGARLSQDHRQARHPGLDPDRAQVRLP